MVDNRQPPQKTQTQPVPFQEYLRANLVWWGFMALLAVIGYFLCGAVWDDVTSGVMEFILVILGGGFTLVSALDYQYEKYISHSQGEPPK